MSVQNYKIKPYNTKFTIYKIPFSQIEKANVSLKDKNKTYSVLKHAQEQEWDIAINGPMFDTKTYQNVTDLIVKGVVNNGGNYADKGIAFGNPWVGIAAYWSTTSNSTNKPVDFIGGAPTLIINSKISLDMKGLPNSFATALTRRTAIGIDGSNIYLLVTLGTNANLNEVATEFLKQGCTYAINLDGGGSSSLVVENKVLYTQNRNVPSVFGIRLKATTTKPTAPTQPIQPTAPASTKTKIIIDAGHNANTSGKRSFDGSLREYEFNLDVANRIKKYLSAYPQLEPEVLQINTANSSTELSERVAYINKSGAKVAVSIHANAFGTDWNTASGWEIYCYKMQGESLKLAQAIKSESIPYLGIKDRGIKDGSAFALVGKTNPTAVLIEHGFYTNKTEVELLKSNDFREKCAIADAKGILKYLGITWIEPKVETPIVDDYYYKVQLGAFEQPTNATKLQEKLKGLGFSTIIKKIKKGE